MARRPAYNTKAEIARRAGVREVLLTELAGAGDDAEDLVPLISAWIQLRRRHHEFRLLFGRPYSVYSSNVQDNERIQQARTHTEMAFSFSYVSRMALEVVEHFRSLSDSASLSAQSLLQLAEPYTSDQLALLKSLSAEANE